MKSLLWLLVAIVVVLPLCGMTYFGAAAEPENSKSLRQKMMKTFNDGNYKEAYEGLSKLALDSQTDPAQAGQDAQTAVQCLQALNRVSEIDAFLEAFVQSRKGQWRGLWAAAQIYMQVPHHGFIIAGEFERGDHRGGMRGRREDAGGGGMVNALERDRVRALQLMVEALPLAREDDARAQVSEFLLSLGNILLNNRGWNESWRLQYLTDLSELPEFEPGWGYYREPSGAPVDEESNPIYYYVPKSFEAAKNDGERWRWCLEQAGEVDPARMNDVRMTFADFLYHQFGSVTLAQWGWFFGSPPEDEKAETGTWALHTLGEDETIARLATGVKRFKLPDEFNFIRICQKVADDPQKDRAATALERLASIFENRRQYPKAADYWRRLLKEFGAANLRQRQRWQDRLDQIVGNWGRFEPIMTQPAGQGATVEYRFRNGDAVSFTAHEIKVDKLLDDVKSYLKSSPRDLQWERISIEDLGFRLVQRNQSQYIGEEVAKWSLKLTPRPDHFDKRETITTPLSKPGAYLLTAEMAGGNTSKIIVWVADTAILRKPLDGQMFYYVADAVTGQPVAKANVEFFGFEQKYFDRPPRHTVVTRQFAEFTDADGQIITDKRQQPDNYQWVLIARTDAGRFAYLGFTGVWYAQQYDAEYRETKVFTITDRPVYRPDQTVKYKFWIRHAQYDMADVSQFAKRTFEVVIMNPKGEEIVAERKQTDDYGGIEGELKLPTDATLGVYQLMIRDQGGGNFRVEEYKKPEYEVTVEAPKEPVMLGEKIEAEIKAKYYFGAPVTQAKVKYKITRSNHDQFWFPPGPWDWFYGPGYWWFSYDYTWYPGWQRWGCERPMPFWWPRGHQPPEVVAEREVEIGPEGVVKVEIDTSVAKALHPNQDHRYEITAEVVDQSRRTIVGQGTVLVARKPFSVYAWVDRGYYRVGDTIHASFAARTLDGKPVVGKGELKLLRITYADGKPVETPVQTWQLDTGPEGTAVQQMTASQAGQYRISYTVTDAKGHSIEGGYVFTVIGEGFDGADFRFNAVELIPEKKEYAPGETMKLQVNVDRAGGTVLLFVRASNGVYLKPRVLRLKGKSTLEEIEVLKKDMPNFFIEAVTVHGGGVHVETKEIVVPPERRVLAVDVEPSAETYKPGEKAKVKVTLRTLEGRPFIGSTVVAIYDKSVEYISGGSNVADIREFFWKWRRHHHPNTEHSLSRGSGNLVPPKAKPMRNIGLFGATAVDEVGAVEFAGAEADQALQMGQPMGGMGGGGGFGGFAPGAGRAVMRKAGAMDAAEAMPMAAAAPPMEAMAMDAAKGEANASGMAVEGQPMVEPTIRTNFADTALWVGSLTTDGDGTAEVSLDMPENLTTWRIKVWGMGHGTKVGEGATDVITRKDLILRMQTPRFFVQTDEVVLTANVHNYLKDKKSVQVALELDGKVLESLTDLRQTVEIEPNGEARIDWRVKVLDEGEAVVRMKALTDEDSDAMEMKIPSYIHGMLKMESYSGSLRPEEQSGKIAVSIPAERRPQQSRIEVRYSPTLAGAMVDALPYLVDYPYGCTEQTLNRFLPTVITQKVLIELGVDLETIRNKQTNLNAQELGEPGERAQQWRRYKRNPVFDEAEVARMVKDGVERLTAMQCSDGGWGWFSGWGERSTPHLTALVVHGLQVARENDVALVPGVLERGVQWLTRYQNEQVELLKRAETKPKDKPWKQFADNIDAFVYMVLVDAGVKNDAMKEYLYRDRTKLAVYSLGMIGLAYEKQGEQEKLDMVLRNIKQYVVEDEENQTAWLNLPGGFWWYWYGSEYEAHAYFLKLLARTEPKGELAPRIVKYLLNNRKHATYWNSTRDTALCIEAMADFLRKSGEMKPEMTVEVYYDGELKQAVEITPKNLFQFDASFVLTGDEITDGKHEVELRKKGRGPLYYNGYVTNFTLEEFITKAGLEIKVERRYYKLVEREATAKVPGARGQVIDQRVERYDRQPIENLGMLKSGDLCEIELEIESKNDYEYVVFEDMKPAGFEPVELRSGYTGNELGAYVEFRDNRVAMFLRALARGRHSMSYRMRAEIPGQFSALPTRAWAMYAPELKANSDEIKLKVED
ncbi:MAG: alpha-2-macroglobulin family protein [Planctomycetota bacterium]